MTMKFRSLVASIMLTILMTGSAFAHEKEAPITGLKDWNGTYISAESFWTDSRSKDFFAEVSKVGDKIGKPKSAEDIANSARLMYYTPFKNVSINGDVMSFTPWAADRPAVKVTYQFVGKINDGKYDWYAFKAKDVTAESAVYAFAILMPPHGHGDSPKHWHARFGATGFDNLMSAPVYQNWWPTFVGEDVTYEKYMKGTTPEGFAKYGL